MKNLLPWFKLKSVPNVGNLLFKRLIERFKTPEKVFMANIADLAQVKGVSSQTASAIKQHNLPEKVRKDYELAVEKKYTIVTMADPDYPQLLLQIEDSPPFLYILGKLDNTKINIAVVGSRNATGYGIVNAKKLCAHLALNGITIVSGMAIGIDTAAHSGALDVNGNTIAVLGSGLERVYPQKNLKLFHQIAEKGAVISEFPLLSYPNPRNFPIRNRIISGISHGTLVVEASEKSGSLITARLAAEQNREVFAIPGSINSTKSKGTHALIRQGAKLVENISDILEEMQYPAENYNSKEIKSNTLQDKHLTSHEKLIYDELGPYPVHIDKLARKTCIEPGKLLSILLQLELKDIVQQDQGAFFSIK